ncbi:Pre-mRNA-splicing factor ATP-dependent RNA helicase-like protein cdc28 [Fusarium oxysporum f. sp. albedinis]|nr:Pre-mRNA-splicing factor ATP-dependent RNA helicase-like protein cdc28 [Fusarium oxysporum f. sp. albedinis]
MQGVSSRSRQRDWRIIKLPRRYNRGYMTPALGLINADLSNFRNILVKRRLTQLMCRMSSPVSILDWRGCGRKEAVHASLVRLQRASVCERKYYLN